MTNAACCCVYRTSYTNVYDLFNVGPCKDHLNKDNTIELHNKVGEVLKVIDDCSQLKDAYAHICLESLGQIKCCKTCKKVGKLDNFIKPDFYTI